LTQQLVGSWFVADPAASPRLLLPIAVGVVRKRVRQRANPLTRPVL
jgi:hypothetical protein